MNYLAFHLDPLVSGQISALISESPNHLPKNIVISAQVREFKSSLTSFIKKGVGLELDFTPKKLPVSASSEKDATGTMTVWCQAEVNFGLCASFSQGGLL